MAKISDLIEQFLIKTLGDSSSLDISRNELAVFFSCAPSQINYVLDTRFTAERGFLIESQRGGGGFVKITRVRFDGTDDATRLILESVGEELTLKRASHILDNLRKEQIVSERDQELLMVVMSDGSLALPINIRDRVRANAFKNVLLFLLQQK